MTLRKYTQLEFHTLLKAIDRNLEKREVAILIGGAAATLCYGSTELTSDIDTFNNISLLRKAYELAVQETGLKIPFHQAGVADAPYHFEDRLKDYKRLRLRNLIVKIPEIHDLILMKTTRADEHDLDVIEEICRKNKVLQSMLIDRYQSEMTHVIGNKSILDVKFAAVLARCFGEIAADTWFNSRSK